MLFIVNPISGHGRKKRLISRLQKDGYKVVCTEYAGHAEKLAREAVDSLWYSFHQALDSETILKEPTCAVFFRCAPPHSSML